MSSTEADNPFRDCLEPGETLLWHGQPNKRRYVLHDMYTLLMLPVGVVSISIVFIELLFLRNIELPLIGTLLYGILMLMPLFVVGICIARLWMTRRTAANTRYAVTDQRILIRTGLFSRQEVSIPLSTLPDLQLSKQSEECGTIIFAPVSRWQQLIGGSWFVGGVAFAKRISGGSTHPPAFVAIDRATEVYNLTENARHQAQQAQKRSETQLLNGSRYSF